MLGSAGGAFRKPIVIPYNTFGVATGDFNGDGNADLLLSGLEFFYGDGAGNFRGPDELLVPGDAGRVYAADYLRRNPNDPPDADYSGFDFWLTKLNNFNGNFINAEMVKAFLSSIEYRQRFGP